MEDAIQIVTSIKNGQVKPIYFLMGEEPYYIDKIASYIEDHLMPEEEKGFNQMVMYGRDTSIDEIISNCKRYPMMAERQVIIVKEAQDLSRTIEKLEAYSDNPQLQQLWSCVTSTKRLIKEKSSISRLLKPE